MFSGAPQVGRELPPEKQCSGEPYGLGVAGWASIILLEL